MQLSAEKPEHADPPSISHDPVNILFNASSIAKKDVWDIDIVSLLDMLVRILDRSGKHDLRVAGMAALSSSLIYRMKVESIFALHRAAMAEDKGRKRNDIDIDLIGMPFRLESTYPVTLDDLLGMLGNLLDAIANPKNNPRSTFEPIQEPPDMKDILVPLEEIIGKYEDLIVSKITGTGTGLLGEISSGLGPIDSIRCFFAVLFLARDQKVDLEQEGDDIRITLAGPAPEA